MPLRSVLRRWGGWQARRDETRRDETRRPAGAANPAPGGWRAAARRFAVSGPPVTDARALEARHERREFGASDPGPLRPRTPAPARPLARTRPRGASLPDLRAPEGSAPAGRAPANSAPGPAERPPRGRREPSGPSLAARVEATRAVVEALRLICAGPGAGPWCPEPERADLRRAASLESPGRLGPALPGR